MNDENNPRTQIDLTRRDALFGLLSATALTTLTSGMSTAAASRPPTPDTKCVWHGRRDANGYDIYNLGFADIQKINNTQTVLEETDLPDPNNQGEIELESGTIYLFEEFVTSNYTLKLPSGTAAPLVGRHGSVSGFVHTGGGTAITNETGGAMMIDKMYVHAPGGTIFDVDGDNNDTLVTESSFSDAAGLGNIASLGTMIGFRTPSFKGCNFEQFDGGLTFDGAPNKIFISGCPFRNVTASNVDILTLADSINVEIVDLVDNYIKGVQSGTRVVHVETGGSPSRVFQYRGTTHDTTVTTSNILTGEAGKGEVGYLTSDSFPLADSNVTGELDLDSATTVTGSGSGPAELTGPTTLNNAERTDTPSNGRIRYIGKRDENLTVHANLSVSGANTEFAIYIGKNGSVVSRTKVLGFLPNSSNPVGTVSIATINMTTNDEFSVFIENVGGTKDLTVEEMALTIG